MVVQACNTSSWESQDHEFEASLGDIGPQQQNNRI